MCYSHRNKNPKLWEHLWLWNNLIWNHSSSKHDIFELKYIQNLQVKGIFISLRIYSTNISANIPFLPWLSMVIVWSFGDDALRGGGGHNHRGLPGQPSSHLSLIQILRMPVSKGVGEAVIHESMSWMFSIWAAGALLTVCRGENTVPAGRSPPHLSEPTPVSLLDLI